MKLHQKKRVEIVVEATRAHRILEMIESLGATGYTMIPEVSGKGHRGVRDEAHVSDVFRNVLIIVIAKEQLAIRIIEESQKLLTDYAGIVYVSDVWVVRDDHF